MTGKWCPSLFCIRSCETSSDITRFIHSVCPQTLNSNSSLDVTGQNLARRRDLSFIICYTLNFGTCVHSEESTHITIFSRFSINLKLRWMGPVTWDALWDFNLHSPGIITLYVWPRTRVQQETPSHWEWWMESQGVFVYSQTRKVRYRFRQIR